MRSLSATIARVSCRERWPLRSRWRSMPTSSAPSDADAPSHALVPALAASISGRPRSIDAFGSTQRLGDALLATRQHERQRPGPVARGQVGREARQPQVQLGEHRAPGDEEKEWFSLRAALETDERVHGIAVDRAAEPVDR